VSGILLTIGLDGGATRCRARARDPAGAKRAEALGGAANIHVDFDQAIVVLRSLIDEILRKAGIADTARVAVGFGLAGLNDCDDARRIEDAFQGFALARAANDATTACIGAHAGADGGLVIAGTGSAAIVRVDGKETIVGGRGFMLGDDGSGARIGLTAMRAATLAYDQLGPSSRLTRECLESFGGDVVALLRWARSAKPGDFGAFAPRVFERAAECDSVAAPIVAEAARAIEGLARRAFALGAEKAALVGGIGESLRPYLEPDIETKLIRPIYDATDGAILLAGGAVAEEELPVR
jgi:glucosamine kinase